MPRVNQVDFGNPLPPPPEQARRLQLAQALQAQGSSGAPVQHWAQGLNRAAQGIVGGLEERQLMEAEQQRQEAYRRDLARLLAGSQARPEQPLGMDEVGQPMAGPPAPGGPGGLAGVLSVGNLGPEAQGLQTQIGLSQALRGPEQAQPPVVKEFNEGDRVVTKQWDPASGRWTTMAEAPRFRSRLLSPEEMAQQAAIRAAGKTSIKNTFSAGNEQLGKPPPGWRMYRDESGEVRMERVAGGPAAAEKAAGEAISEAKKQDRVDTANLVLEDIRRAKKLAKENPRLTAGFFGNILKNWAGTDAADVSSLIDTIGANISFEALNKMREQSKTGGALGNVTERELTLLAATHGSLQQSQSPEQFLANLERLDKQFNEVVNGPVAPVLDGPTATNPKTGERIIFRNGKWEKL